MGRTQLSNMIPEGTAIFRVKGNEKVSQRDIILISTPRFFNRALKNAKATVSEFVMVDIQIIHLLFLLVGTRWVSRSITNAPRIGQVRRSYYRRAIYDSLKRAA